MVEMMIIQVNYNSFFKELCRDLFSLIKQDLLCYVIFFDVENLERKNANYSWQGTLNLLKTATNCFLFLAFSILICAGYVLNFCS